MKDYQNRLFPSKIARISGLLYCLMIPLGIFGIMYIPTFVIVAESAVTTAENILANIFVFRLSIVSALLVQISHIFIVLLLYKLLKHVNQNLASLMVIFMLVSIPITMINELNNYAALLLLGNSNFFAGLSMLQLQEISLTCLKLHDYGILIASIFWGLWLFPMGYLVYKSTFLPKFLGILLIISCIGYIIDSLCRLILPEYNTTAFASIIGFTLFGEIVFPVWLLIRGVSVDKWMQQAVEKD